jgi:hypothetical protein
MGPAHYLGVRSHKEWKRMAKRKTCKGECGKQYAITKFPKSATSADGRLGYCSLCWGKKMSVAKKKRDKDPKEDQDTTNGEVKTTRPYKKRNSNPPGDLGVFNKALDAANGTKEIWQVVAEDGDQKEFRGKNARRHAYKLALMWKLDGFECTLREIHEYKPSLRLEVVG